MPICTDINYNNQDLTNVAKPTYLTVSADPLSPPTVENRIAIGVFLPTFEKTLALQYFVMSCVTSKYPKAPNGQKHINTLPQGNTSK
jgi:hypothetical protein